MHLTRWVHKDRSFPNRFIRHFEEKKRFWDSAVPAIHDLMCQTVGCMLTKMVCVKCFSGHEKFTSFKLTGAPILNREHFGPRTHHFAEQTPHFKAASEARAV